MTKAVKIAEPGAPLAGPPEPKGEPNPFTTGDWRMIAYAWSGFFLRAMLIVGAIFSALQYLQSRQEKRIERTLSLVELWERDDYQEAQTAMKRRLADLNRQSASLITDKTTKEELEIIAASTGLQAMTESGGAMPLADFEERFDRVVYFLSRLSSCVTGNLCDRAVADEYFLGYARSFWSYFSDYVERERKRGSPSLAAAIEAYLKLPR